MARKDLSRTVIEGGRYFRNCWERRASHGVERASTRAWLDQVEIDVDEAEESTPPPIKHVGKSFRDKLAPAQRWLASQVGRPWSKVFSELCTKFDTRTVAGRHVVNDHMLDWVNRHPLVGHSFHRRFQLYVDTHGILRKPELFGRAHRNVRGDVETWAAGRVCALTYRGWWWFRREHIGEPCHARDCKRPHFKLSTYVRYHGRSLVPIAPMTRAEVRDLDRLDAYDHSQRVIASPWPSR